MEFNQEKTEYHLISTGVPLESILGPFLFLVYNNNLARYAQNNKKLAIFADETSILKSGKQTESLLEPDLDKISNWFSDNKLSLDTSKCEVMNFAFRNRTQLTLVGQKLPSKYSVNSWEFT